MNRVALTADLQLQMQPRYSTLSASGVTTRLDDFIACFDWIVDQAVERECDTLIAMGDIFDSRTVIDVCVIDRACRAFARAAKRLDVHVLVGNHDAYLRTPRLNSTQMLAGVATVHEQLAQVGPFVVVPWTDDPDAYRASLARAGKLRAGKSKPDYLLSHGMFGDAVPMAKGLPIEWLQEAGWRGVFLGDVHDPVVLQKSPTIRYVGSPLQIHFGDAGRPRGFVVLDTETAKHTFVTNTVSPRFHVLKTMDDVPEIATTRDFLRVKAEDQDLSDALVREATKLSGWVETEATASTSGAMARIEAAGTLNDQDLLTAYCEHVSVDPDSLVPLGLEFLAQARDL